MNDELENWLSWLRNKVDWYDTFIEKEDELFKDIDRELV